MNSGKLSWSNKLTIISLGKKNYITTQNHSTNNHKTFIEIAMIEFDWNVGSGLGQANTCDRVKLVNVLNLLNLYNTI